MNKIILAITLALIASQAQAEILTEKSFACNSEDKFIQIRAALTSEPIDLNAVNWLLKNGCIMARSDFPITVLDKKPNGIAEIRVYNGEISAHLWTHIVFIGSKKPEIKG